MDIRDSWDYIIQDNRPESDNHYLRYPRALGWILLLIFGYVCNRFMAAFGLPYDAQSHTWLGHGRNLCNLCFFGFVQSWFTELIDNPGRWVFIMQNRWFFFVFIASGLTYTLISCIPSIDEAVTEDADFTSIFLLTISSVATLLITLFGWHIFQAKRIMRDPTNFWSYLLSRLCIIVVVVASYIVIRNENNPSGPAKLHLHHYFIAWVVSLVSVFNHPISIGFLAITSGIFVQGISVYSAASLFYRGDHDSPCPEIRLD